MMKTHWTIGAGLISLSMLLAGFSSVGATSAPQGVTMGKSTLTLTGSPPTDPENFNPLSPNDFGGADFIYEPMYVVDQLTGKATPWLATSYHWVNSTEVQFTIRNGVKWSNGSPFTAADVSFTFNLMKKYPATDLNDVWGFLKSVTSSGNTVTFTLKKPDYPAWALMANQVIVYPNQFQHVNPVTFTNPHPIGTGPYRLQTFAPEQYQLAVNPTYWQRDKIRVPSITFINNDDNTTEDLYLSQGKYDWAAIFTPGIQKTYVDKNPKLYHYWFSTGSAVSLYFNLTEKPFNNVVFRRAIAYAVNRKTISTNGEYGYEPPANQSMLSSGLNAEWLDPSLAKKYTYTYQPAKAQSLLASIGYHKKNGELIGPNGQQLTFTLQVPSGYTDWVQDTAIIQKELAELGIKVQVFTPSTATYTSDVDTGHFQAALSGIGSESNPYYDYFYQMSSAESAPVGQVTTSNTERWNNARTNTLIAELEQTDNLAKEHQLVDELQQIAFTQVPTIALVYGANWYEYQTNHYVGWPTAKNPYTYPPLYSGTDVLEVITHLRPAK